MGFMIIMLVVYFIMLGVDIGLSLFVSRIIHWYCPNVDKGLSLFLGLLFVNLAFYFFVQLARVVNEYGIYMEDHIYEEDCQYSVNPTRRSRRKKK